MARLRFLAFHELPQRYPFHSLVQVPCLRCFCVTTVPPKLLFLQSSRLGVAAVAAVKMSRRLGEAAAAVALQMFPSAAAAEEVVGLVEAAEKE